MGKEKNRLPKGVTQAKSERAAELLAKGGVQFVGFDALGGAEVPPEELDENVKVLLSKLKKKDPITKIKALSDLREVVVTQGGLNEEMLELLLPHWGRLYSRLTLDYERKVRELTQIIFRHFIVTLKKKISPQLKSLVPVWLCAQYDTSIEVASIATETFDAIFPDEKRSKTLLFCKDEILSHLEENLIELTAESLNESPGGGYEDPFEIQTRYERVVVASLLALAHMMNVTIRDVDPSVFDIFLSSSKFWKFFKSESKMVRSAMLDLSGVCVKHRLILPSSASFKTIAVSIYSSFADPDPSVIRSCTIAALQLASTYPESFEIANPRKVLYPSLWGLLRDGARTCGSVVYPFVLSLLPLIPPAIIGEVDKFGQELFTNLMAGVRQVRFDRVSLGALIACYFDAVVFFFPSMTSEELSSTIYVHLFSLLKLVFIHIDSKQVPALEMEKIVSRFILALTKTENKALINPFWQYFAQFICGEIDALNQVDSSTVEPDVLPSTSQRKDENGGVLSLNQLASLVSFFQPSIMFRTNPLFGAGELRERVLEMYSETMRLVVHRLLTSSQMSLQTVHIATTILPLCIHRASLHQPVETEALLFHPSSPLGDSPGTLIHSILLPHFVGFVSEPQFPFDEFFKVVFSFLLFEPNDAPAKSCLTEFTRACQPSPLAFASFLSQGCLILGEVFLKLFREVLYATVRSHVVNSTCAAVEARSPLPYPLLIAVCSSRSLTEPLFRAPDIDFVFNQIKSVLENDEDIENDSTLATACLFSELLFADVGRLLASPSSHFNASLQSSKTAFALVPLLFFLSHSFDENQNETRTAAYRGWEAGLRCLHVPSMAPLRAQVVAALTQDLQEKLTMLRSANDFSLGAYTHTVARQLGVVLAELGVTPEASISLILPFVPSQKEGESRLEKYTMPFFGLSEALARMYLTPFVSIPLPLTAPLQPVLELGDVLSECVLGHVVGCLPSGSASALQASELAWLYSHLLVAGTRLALPDASSSPSSSVPSEMIYSVQHVVGSFTKEFSPENVEFLGQILSSLIQRAMTASPSLLTTYVLTFKNILAHLVSVSLPLEGFAGAWQALMGLFREVSSESFLRLVCSVWLIETFIAVVLPQFPESSLWDSVLSLASAVKGASPPTLKDKLSLSLSIKAFAALSSHFIAKETLGLYSQPLSPSSSEAGVRALHRQKQARQHLVCFTALLPAVSPIMTALIAWREVDDNILVPDGAVVKTLVLDLQLHDAFICDVAHFFCNVLEYNVANVASELWDLLTCSCLAWLELPMDSMCQAILVSRGSACLTRLHDLVAILRQTAMQLTLPSTLTTLIQEWKDFFLSATSQQIVSVFAKALALSHAFALAHDLPRVLNLLCSTMARLVALLQDDHLPNDDAFDSQLLKTLSAQQEDLQTGAYLLLRRRNRLLAHLSLSDPTSAPIKAAQKAIMDTATLLFCRPVLTEADVTQQYLLAALLVLERLQVLDTEERAAAIQKYAATKDIVLLLAHVFSILSNNDLPAQLPEEVVFGQDLVSLSCTVYLRVLQACPVVARTWMDDYCNRETRDILQKITEKFFSPILIQKEMAAIYSQKKGFDNLVVKPLPSSNEVVAIYTVDSMSIELEVKISPLHPLLPVKVECVQRLKLGEDQWRKWLLQMQTFLLNQNGTILDAILLWKKNIDRRFEGVEDCPICYSVIHAGTAQIPSQKCKTCKHLFHSACLFKWFTSSNQSTCPLCRNVF